MIDIKANKNKKLKALVLTLELLALAIFVYLVVLPFYPNVEYNIQETKAQDGQNIISVKKKVSDIKNHLPVTRDKPVNRLIITKIGINAPIIDTANERYGLNHGAWHLPESTTPDQKGNMVISGHRFKYFPPNNLTFYLLDKLTIGDIIFISWQGQDYYYKVTRIKIVKDTDVSILDQSNKKLLTLFTCDPIFSQENRLVVVSEPL
jgi:LPXTG-site transpeptidase (sortase) family protein